MFSFIREQYDFNCSEFYKSTFKSFILKNRQWLNSYTPVLFKTLLVIADRNAQNNKFDMKKSNKIKALGALITCYKLKLKYLCSHSIKAPT